MLTGRIHLTRDRAIGQSLTIEKLSKDTRFPVKWFTVDIYKNPLSDAFCQLMDAVTIDWCSEYFKGSCCSLSMWVLNWCQNDQNRNCKVGHHRETSPPRYSLCKLQTFLHYWFKTMVTLHCFQSQRVRARKCNPRTTVILILCQSRGFNRKAIAHHFNRTIHHHKLPGWICPGP